MSSTLTLNNVESGAFTNVAYYGGVLRRGIGSDLTQAARYTALVGTWARVGAAGIAYKTGTAVTAGVVEITGSDGGVQNLRVLGQIALSQANYAGIVGRGSGQVAWDGYSLLARVDSDQLATFVWTNMGPVQLAATAHDYTGGETPELALSFDGGSQYVSGWDITNSVTVARVNSVTYTSGQIGFIVGSATTVTAGRVFGDHAGAAPSYISPTLDAGSSLTWDVAGWGESLGSGDVTVDIDIRDSGNYGAWGVAGLTNPFGSTFATATGRYYNFRVNITGNAALTGLPEIAKGNDAGGGGSSTTITHGGMGGGGGGPFRPRRIIALSPAQMKILRRARGLP